MYIFKNYLHDVHLIMNNLNVSTLIVFLELVVFFGGRERAVIHNKEEE